MTLTIAAARTPRIGYVGTEGNNAISPTVGNDSGSNVFPARNYNGVLSDTGTITYTTNETSIGTLFLSPQAGDSGTKTIAPSNASCNVYGKYSLGYVTLPAGSGAGFTIGSANIQITESIFWAVLYRLNKATAIEGNTGDVNLMQTAQNGGTTSKPLRKLFVGGSASTTSSSVRRHISLMADGWTASVATSLLLPDDWTSTISPTPAGGANVKMTAYGDQSGANGSPSNGWIWAFCKGAAAGENESAVYTMTVQNSTSGQNNLSVGHKWVNNQWLSFPNTHLINSRTNTSFPTTSGTTSGATATFSNVTLVLGDNALGASSKAIDIAAVIALSRRPTMMEMTLLMDGMDPADLGLQPVANNDFCAYFGSLAQANATATRTGYLTGTPIAQTGSGHVYSATGGPVMQRKLGTATSSTPLVVTVSNGAITS